MVDKIQSFLSSKHINKIINAPLKVKLPIMIIVFALFVFVFYGLLVGPVISKANQVQNHIQSMEAQIPRLIKKEKDLASSGITIIDLSPASVKKNKYLDLYALNFKAKLSGNFSQLISFSLL